MRQETLELIRKLIHQNREFARLKLDALGLYRGQPRMLYILAKEDGLTKKDLANRFDVKAPTITKMVERLEKNGFVFTQKDENDRRITRVFISEKGRDVQAQLVEFFNESKEVYFKDMTNDDIETLHRLLTKITDNVSANIEECGSRESINNDCSCGGEHK